MSAELQAELAKIPTSLDSPDWLQQIANTRVLRRAARSLPPNAAQAFLTMIQNVSFCHLLPRSQQTYMFEPIRYRCLSLKRIPCSSSSYKMSHTPLDPSPFSPVASWRREATPFARLLLLVVKPSCQRQRSAIHPRSWLSRVRGISLAPRRR